MSAGCSTKKRKLGDKADTDSVTSTSLVQPSLNIGVQPTGSREQSAMNSDRNIDNDGVLCKNVSPKTETLTGFNVACVQHGCIAVVLV